MYSNNPTCIKRSLLSLLQLNLKHQHCTIREMEGVFCFFLLLVISSVSQFPQCAGNCVLQRRQLFISFSEGGENCRVKLPQNQTYCQNYGANCGSYHVPLTYHYNHWFLMIQQCRPTATTLVKGEVSADLIRTNPDCITYGDDRNLRYAYVNPLGCTCRPVDKKYSPTICPYTDCHYETSNIT